MRRLLRQSGCLLFSIAVTVSAGAATSNAPPHWAFQPIASPKPPAVKTGKWVKTEIDRFILAKLEQNGLRPAAAADKRTLIRRATFDLLGLPPTPEEVTAFERDNSRSAFSNVVGRLLASPRYGERWGRHWLDVARYSDTKGYVYAREERRFLHAPSYRDWVIRAFNEDLPYNRFLLLQIAADQLAPEGSPDLVAMGFVTGGRRFLGVTHDIIDDRIDVVTRGTLALTVACARCHDHKYDPIPTQDYYSLYGVFHGSDERLMPLAAPDDKELADKRRKFADKLDQRRSEANARLRSRAGDYLAAQLELKNYPEEGFDQLLSAEDLIPFSVRRWRDFLRQTQGEPHPIFGPWNALSPLADFEKEAPSTLVRALAARNLNPFVASAFSNSPATLREAAQRYGKIFADAGKQTNSPGAAELLAFLQDPRSPAVVPDTGMVNTEYFFPTTVCEELWKLQGDVERRLIELGTPAALVLADHEPEPLPRVFNRGSASRLGDEVPRQFLKVLAGPERKPFKQGSGRLELARAIASADNPLTARVMINRIWQHHFGASLVKTPSDFGLRAEPPSHPELLDWLASRFIAEGWSVKAMHRLILSSAVYQQGSVNGIARSHLLGTSAVPTRHTKLSLSDSTLPLTDPFAAEAGGDPDNRLLSRFPIRRLEFEALRDAMLAASGDLDLTMGGKPVELLDAGNKRRTVYAFVDRQFLPGTFRTFDFANPDIHVAVRHETTVPQQALFFLNGNFAASRAKTLAKRFVDEPPERLVQQLHQLLYQRAATKGEVAAALRFVNAAKSDPPPAPPPVRETQWRYGAGEYDEAEKRLKSFTPLPHFTGSAWQGAAAWPGGESGWAQLTADGGHPGNTRAQACVRRWVAPRDATVNITGTLKHEPEQGDGVRGFIISSRHGELKAVTAHKSKADMSATNIVLKTGDTLDFVVDIGGTLNADQFLWAPGITADGTKWDARAEFDGPRPAPELLSAWEQYAQVLLLANEFAFVD